MPVVKIEIMGQTLTVNSDDGDEWAQFAAGAVNEKIRKIRARPENKIVNSINVAIQAALNFAEELEQLRREHRAMLSRLEKLNERLSEAVGRDDGN